MLRIYHSNRMEHLVGHLADTLQAPAASAPFAPEVILVQSNGMRRWVSMELAQRLAICANLEFPFPAAFIWRAYRAVLPATPVESPFAIEQLVWQILRCFDELGDEPVFAPLQGYLHKADPLERYQLAGEIATTLDQYLVYRPDWIEQWESGADEYWQAALWRKLAVGQPPHRARLHQAFIARIKKLKKRPAGIPARLACIGIASLPAAYLEVFYYLARWCDIHLYLLDPCRQYWGLTQAEREIARHIQDAEVEALYLETGNRLLASWGRQGRDFQHLVADIDAQPVELFEEVLDDSLLHCIQADILDLHNRGRNHDVCNFDTISRALPTKSLDPADVSLQVHVCHSALREVEVLYDQLLDLFQRCPDLKASEVAVLTPDIETYAPAIRAVFGTAEREQRIPFGIADRPLWAESTVAAAFLKLLELPGSRFTVNQVMTLLESPVIHRRFGLNDVDLPLLIGWLRETKVRWGIDARNREALELPPTAEHTWQAGLERLLLGFALPVEGRSLYADILPFDAIEGEPVRIMGRLQYFARQLFGLDARLEGEHPVAVWRQRLQQLLDDFIAVPEEQSQEWENLRAALEALEQNAMQAGFDRPVPLAVVHAWLKRHLADYSGVEAFLSGGVTFCAMLPMRSIPFRVICLLGLNNDTYPRPQRPLDFDLMVRHPRRGDRSRRQEDRYLFLEALLSAREVLYLSYVGNNIRDNSIIPPSVLLSELLDYIRQGFYPADDPEGDPLELVVTRHPLQAFSRRYFTRRGKEGHSRLFSYSQILCAAAREQGHGHLDDRPLFMQPLPEPEDEYRRLDFQSLIHFYRNPTRYLLQNRLQLALREGDEVLETREPFLLEKFADSRIRQELLDRQLEGQTTEAILALVRAQGLLPHGQIGTSLFGREVRRVQPLLQFHAQAGAAITRLEVNLPLGDFHLSGWLGNITADGLLDSQVDKLGAKAYLDLWIRHLLLNCLRPEGVTPASVLQCLGERLTLVPVEQPETVLQELLVLYWQGLRQPLKFFPRSSLAYMQASDKQDPLKQARNKWESSDHSWGESEDLYYQFVFRQQLPLDDEFVDLTKRIYGPLLEHHEGMV